jgi:4-hydroxy-2-oxoheptanedioate aldolase
MTELPPNPFKHAIRTGRQQIGVWVSLASPYSAEIVAGSGFDWAVIDTEHSPNEVDTTLAQLQVMASYPVSPVVRPAWNDKVLIKRHLDAARKRSLFLMFRTRPRPQRRWPPSAIRCAACAGWRASRARRATGE